MSETAQDRNPQDSACFSLAPGLNLEASMPRGPRLNIPDGIYHVMTRGHRKTTIFEDDHDRQHFIEIVAEAAMAHDVRVFAETRLGNHYHQVVQTPDANLPDYMGCVNGTFAQFFNRRYQRIGHVYNERYKAILVDNDFYLGVLIGYVLTNPVKHRFVDHPGDWKWSSYRATVGIEPPPDYLCLDWLLSVFPSASLQEAQDCCRRYLQTAPPEADELLQRPVNGSSAFERELRQHIGATLFMSSLPRSYRMLDRPPLAELFHPQLTIEERNKEMLRAHVLHAYRMSEIARALCMHPSSVSRIVAALRRKARNGGRC
jgi:REP element-mobilizing transposase RayT